MMVLFVSQCEKRALKRTRRVLDSFANRIGDNTWQTIITKEGLEAVRKLLRKTATKSTAVSCHWIRSRSRSDLMWIVGNRGKFNYVGEVPVHYTHKTILDQYKEPSWKYLNLIKALTAVAALLHDWGKANNFFQKKLRDKVHLKGDPVRHEWISASLFLAFVSIDPDNWLQRMANREIDEVKILSKFADLDQEKLFACEEWPIEVLIIVWLIVSHHKLPSFGHKEEIMYGFGEEKCELIADVMEFVERNWGYENSYDQKEFAKYVGDCYRFFGGLMSDSLKWTEILQRWAKRLVGESESLQKAIGDGSIRVILHHTRLALMLGDHEYSSKESDKSFRSSTKLYANTDKNGLKQKLDEHLCGVCAESLHIAHLLPLFQNGMPLVEDKRSLRKPSPKAFVWQDLAVKRIRKLMGEKKRGKKRGVFGVNMASTGKGKTIANAKIMQALSENGKSFRYNLALGLRTLTLQTGDEYRERIGLTREEMAVLIGSTSIMELYYNDKDNGSESSQELMDIDIDYANFIDEDAFSTLLKNEKEKSLLYAPVLVSTIDHLMGAVTSKKGGKHILPALRVLSSDVVIDEIDDFSGSDLVAIGRLVHLAGMLGRKVILSSATIPPDLAEGYYHAYQEGWKLFSRSDDTAENVILSFWIDEFGTQGTYLHNQDSVEQYRENHHHFLEKRIKKLGEIPPKRKAEIVSIHLDEPEEGRKDYYFTSLANTITKLHHEHHTVDQRSGKRVSFGVIRMANITPSVEMARFLAQNGVENIDLFVMSYHSNQVMLLRHIQECHLDSILRRKEKAGEVPKAFENRTIRERIDSAEGNNVAFIVVSTPVEEVGRDHDFDWTIVEPSSFRSIIQLAGRVLRHRDILPSTPNVALMQYNLKAFIDGDKKDKAYFVRPGFETILPYLETHNLALLVDTEVIARRLDAVPRIVKADPLQPRKRLADLEHYNIHKYLSNYKKYGANSFEGYLKESWYLTAHPLYLHPFREGKAATKVILVYDEKRDRVYFAEIDYNGDLIDRDNFLGFERAEDHELNKRLWLHRDYVTIVKNYAREHHLSVETVCRRFGELSFIRYNDYERYRYSDDFGLYKKEVP